MNEDLDSDELFEERYRELRGYLSAFIELQYEERMTESDINAAGAKERPLFISLILKQGREVLTLDPFPMASIMRCAGIWFDSGAECRLWLARMLDELDLLTSPKGWASDRLYVSLKELLQTGVFACIAPPVTIQQILKLLGEPDAVGGASRKHPDPRIYVYGSVELYVSQASPSRYTGALWDADAKGEFRFSPRLEVRDWEWKPKMPRVDVEQALTDLGLSYEYVHQQIAERQWMRLASGVNISFDEDGLLGSVSSLA